MNQPEMSADDRARRAVHRFCGKPYESHGAKRTSGPHKGWYEHDWGDLVQDIAHIDLGRILPIPTAFEIGKLVRREFPNNSTWDDTVTSEGAEERILFIIREALAIHR